MTNHWILASAILAMTAVTGRASAVCEPQWLAGAGVPGVDGTVYTMTPWDPDGDGAQPTLLVVGGSLSIAGNVPANNIACWNPAAQTWTTMGTGLNSWVYALAVLDGKLYAGGYFTTAGGNTANGLACWDPAAQTWSVVGGGLATAFPTTPASVSALTVLGGKLYVAGTFTTAGGVSALNIACFDPVASTWSALTTGISGRIYALAALGSRVYVGGDFTTAGGVTVNRIACWRPSTSTWSALGTGVGGVEYPCVYSLAVLFGALCVGGDFTTADGAGANHFAEWDPISLTWFNGGSETAPVRAMAVDDTQLYALHVACQGPIRAFDLTSSTWSDLGPALQGSTAYSAGALAVLDGKLYAGSDFTSAGGVLARGIASWDLALSGWSALASGIDGAALAMTALNGKTYVGGRFCTVGPIEASKIASFDTVTSLWSTLGSGLDDAPLSLAALNGKIYAGGQFTHAGPVVANQIACWDPAAAAWSALGTGISGPHPEVAALAVLGGKLYVGGSFTSASGTSANNIACWNPATSTWSVLGTGMDDRVNSLSVLNGKLYAGGFFTTAGGLSAKGVACWNPALQTWSALGSGLGTASVYTVPSVRATSVLGGRLYVAGTFTIAGGVSAKNIAAWNPGTATWSALGTGVDGDSYALTALSGKLYLGGSFDTVGGVSASSIASWDPGTQTWSAFGIGMDEAVQVLAVLNGALHAGGYFATADTQVSAYLATATACCVSTSADLDQDCDVDSSDFDLFTACATGPSIPYDSGSLPAACTLQADGQHIIPADFDRDGDVDQDDFGSFQRCYGGEGISPNPACTN